MEGKSRIIEYYEDEEGQYPAFEWLESLKDKRTRVVIKGRIRRLEEGNFGYTRGLGDGVTELKIDYGPGYRVYVGLMEISSLLFWWLEIRALKPKI
ncbi:MAG: type II toxin-antitoxin system RelE/ParE family toxin [Oligoflexia bacterium]|nr:type II toxin-antitoxin system RelE/ParE family toxin [Oligoflexia bacterium]